RRPRHRSSAGFGSARTVTRRTTGALVGVESRLRVRVTRACSAMSPEIGRASPALVEFAVASVPSGVVTPDGSTTETPTVPASGAVTTSTLDHAFGSNTPNVNQPKSIV